MQNPPLSGCIESNACHFTTRVREQQIDGRFKELALHALSQHVAIPMILSPAIGVYSQPSETHIGRSM